jgi:hypothetical protein
MVTMSCSRLVHHFAIDEIELGDLVVAADVPRLFPGGQPARVLGQLRDASGDVHAKAQRQQHRDDDAEQTDADQGARENRDLAPYDPQAVQREGPLPFVEVVARGHDLHRQAADPWRARQARFRGGVARAGETEVFADDVESLR